ncbi:MAG: PilZ domain-containing protein [Deltaproteobacteria bacterium]|nr:MAG: PilZ domain-containing protein [Deltaproteobacteria bacterium]
MTEQARRVHERFEVELDVTVLHGERELTGKTINVSLGGMFIAFEESLPFGTPVKVRVTLPALKEASDLPATVRWVTPDGIGVQFGPLRAKETWAMNELVKG